MLKKIFSLTLIGLLITIVLIPLETFANENSLSYEQIIEKLENTKEDIKLNYNNLNLAQKENIREQSYELVNVFGSSLFNVEKTGYQCP